jgi:hypothetical protein
MNPELVHILNELEPISLDKMDRVKLLNRTDTKFVFNTDILPAILSEIQPNYYILEIKNKRTNSYQTLYYDSQDLHSYFQHHNGKANRIKVRFRKYVESELVYLEVKYKNNKSRTIKARIKTTAIEEGLSNFSKQFVADNSYSFFEGKEIIPTLWNSFTRLTLVHKTANERLTIDLNLGFKNFSDNREENIPHVIIAEVKQEKASANSDFIKAIRKHHIRQSNMSKYCVGTALLHKDLKQNNFKERILNLNKLQK